MMIAREDFKRLRLTFATAVLLIGLGITGVTLSENMLIEARKANAAVKSAAAGAKKRVDQVAEEEREIKMSMLWYSRMASKGMVDQENHLDLLDVIAKIKSARKLFEIRYNIEPKRALAYPGITLAGGIELVASRMKLDMQLLHEGDLLKFLSDLNGSALSHISVRRCTLDRIERGPVRALANVPQINSSCEVDLVSLN